MMRLGEHETDANLIYASRDSIRAEIQIYTQGFQHIGAAALAAHGTITVFGNGRTRACRDETGCR
jgi:hypothetical protein